MKNFAKAFSALQGEINNVRKDSKSHHGKYASLDTILQEVRPLLAKHGMSVYQHPITMENSIGVKTRLLHESGEEIIDEFWLPTNSDQSLIKNPQTAGSVITYFRRYALAAALGIHQSDDVDQVGGERPVASRFAKERTPSAIEDAIS